MRYDEIKEKGNNYGNTAPSENTSVSGETSARTPSAMDKVVGKVKDFGEKAVGKAKDLGTRFTDRFKDAQEKAQTKKEYNDYFNGKQDPHYRVPSKMSARQKEMADTIEQTPDLIQTGAEKGEEANKAMQNIEVPRSKLVSYNDIINSDEFKGQRTPYMVNAIGSNLANLLTGKE